jgi:hypothetical protein
LSVIAVKLVCRYLFRRCDNEPAPWTAADAGDGAWREDDLPEDATAEITRCPETVTYAGSSPHWDYDAEKGAWGWARPPPAAAGGGGERAPKRGATLLESLRKDVRVVRFNRDCIQGWARIVSQDAC